METTRRDFLKNLTLVSGALGLELVLPRPLMAAINSSNLFSGIGLCELSLAPSISRGRMQHLDFAKRAKQNWNISIVEYGSVFFRDHVSDQPYLKDMLSRSQVLGVKGLRINISNEGSLADPDAGKRNLAVENHKKWITAAKILECDSVSVTLEGEGESQAVKDAALESMQKLIQEGKQQGINVYAINTIGFSANGSWLASLMKQLNDSSSGLVVDLANFCIKKTAAASQSPADLMHVRCLDSYDRYQGVQELMPFAKGIHARTKKFDGQGLDIETDYFRMMEIINASGYRGTVSIAYEGGLYLPADQCSYYNDDRGILITKELIEKTVNALK